MGPGGLAPILATRLVAGRPERARRPTMEQKPTPFLSDVQEIRRRAREHVEKGAVTPDYKADLTTALKLLNEALATEIVCVLRCRRHYFMATGIHREGVAGQFKE